MVAVLLAAGAHVGERRHGIGVVGRHAHPHGPSQDRVALEGRAGPPGVSPPRPLRHGRHEAVQLGLLGVGPGGDLGLGRGDPLGGPGGVGRRQEEGGVGRHHGRRGFVPLAQGREGIDQDEGTATAGTTGTNTTTAAAATLGDRLAPVERVGQPRHDLPDDPPVGPVVLPPELVAHPGVEAGAGPRHVEGDGVGRIDRGGLERRAQLPGAVGPLLEQVGLEEGRRGVADRLGLDFGRQGRQLVVVRAEDVGIAGVVGAAAALEVLLLPPLPSLPDGLELLAGLDVAVAEVGYGPDLLGRDGAGQRRAGLGQRQPGGQYLGDRGSGDGRDVQSSVDGGAGSILCG